MSAETIHIVGNIFALILFALALFSMIRRVGRYEFAEDSPLSVKDVITVFRSCGVSFVITPFTLLFALATTVIRLSVRLVQRYIKWVFNR